VLFGWVLIQFKVLIHDQPVEEAQFQDFKSHLLQNLALRASDFGGHSFTQMLTRHW
jgi:hypothetical protein